MLGEKPVNAEANRWPEVVFVKKLQGKIESKDFAGSGSVCLLPDADAPAERALRARRSQTGQ